MIKVQSLRNRASLSFWQVSSGILVTTRSGAHINEDYLKRGIIIKTIS
jgi:hypothetical protein